VAMGSGQWVVGGEPGWLASEERCTSAAKPSIFGGGFPRNPHFACLLDTLDKYDM